MTVLPFIGSGGSLLTVWDLGYLLRWKIIFFYLLSGWILGYLLMYCEIGKGSTRFLSTLILCPFLHIIGQRVQESMGRVDSQGVLLRTLQLNPRRRRRYSVPAPNSLWHIDGNHKLIRYQKNINNINYFYKIS